ncbi:MAG: carboxypeptidase regulatory-like domain-containing protein [Leptolinea sp.]|jgi:hypothetical protein|nr:carboxypeptidase regulatory-like domain-containing protein [Leptolinea sp.]
MNPLHSFPLAKRLASIVLIGGLFLQACTMEPKRQMIDPARHPDVLATFTVELSSPLIPEAGLSLEWVDPLASHNLNPIYLPMQPIDTLHYQVDAPVKKGQLLRYRYVQTGTGYDVELGINGLPIPSRFFYITEHSHIQDTILGFANIATNISRGSIEGRVILSGSNNPAAGVLITTAGISTTSTIDGKFSLQGIPVGTQNITIFSPDGSVEPLQQQAVVEADAVTPINVSLSARKSVNVTFIVSTPGDTPPLAALRLFGNLSQMGDSYAGLFGGTDLIQNRAVTLSQQGKNKYLAVLQLPVDSEIQYIYSLGDTFWNRETSAKGMFSNRVFFVPDKDTEIEDQVESWETVNYQPITFQFLPPATTSATDHIQIQFNAYGWMDPLDMWPVGDGTYEFQLFSPLNFSKSVDYRFCRSEICGTKDTETQRDQLFSFQAGASALVLPIVGGDWTGWQPSVEPTTVTTEQTEPRGEGFHTAVELSPSYRASWLRYYDAALDSAANLNANTLILPIPWTFRSYNPVWLDLDISQNPSIQDTSVMISHARNKGLKVYLMAVSQYPSSPMTFWEEFSKTESHWDSWFVSVLNFYQSTAHLATATGADGIILGDNVISSILGKTNKTAGIFDVYPENSFQRWDDIFSKVRDEYTGKVLLALNFDDLQNQNGLLSNSIDGFYILNLGMISDTPGNVAGYTESIANKLDETLAPLQSSTGKEIWLGLDFPAITSAYLGFVEISGQSMDTSILDFPAPNQPELVKSLQEQANLYNAVFPEANRRGWINGLVTRKYLVPDNNQDQSSSVRGKPAADIVWYWFSSMTGNPTQ